MEIDRYGNVARHHPANAIQNEREIYHDVRRARGSGWRINGHMVTFLFNQPFQSINEPDGRHAYNPAARQYPQVDRDEWQYGRIAETPTDRAYWWNQMRPSDLPPGAQIPFYVDGVGRAIGDPTRLQYPNSYGGPHDPVRMIDTNQQGMQGPGGGFGSGGGYGRFGGDYGTR